MKKQKNSMFIIVIGFIIAVGRLLFSDIKIKYNREYAILVIMAIVNYVALGFVFLFLNNDFYNCCEHKISKSGLDTNQKKTRKRILHILSAFFLITYFVLGLIYVLFLKSSDLNDAISIIALAVSIAANALVDDFGDLYYKLIIFLSNVNFRKASHKEQEKP